MSNPAQNQVVGQTSQGSDAWRVLEPVLVSVAYVVMVCLAGPWWDVYAFDKDEGLNLAIAALIEQGVSLYSEIYLDQPPLMSFVLAIVHKLSHGSVIAARAVILGLSGLLVGGLFVLINRFHGRIAAWTAVMMLAASQIFLKNSVSVMFGVPAIALAVLSLVLAPGYGDKRALLKCVLAGIIFAISLQIKMFTLLILPILFLVVLETSRTPESIFQYGQAFLRLLATGCALVAGLLIIAIVSGATDIDQLLLIHAQARDSDSLSQNGGFDRVYWLMRTNEPVLLIVGIFGLLAASIRFKCRDFIVLFWVTLTIIALSTHRPLWKHHLVLVVVPLCWACGVGISWLFEVFRRKVESSIITGIVCGIVFLTPYSVIAYENFKKAGERFNTPVFIIEAMERLQWYSSAMHVDQKESVNPRVALKSKKQWILTDSPMDAYRSGLLVLPPLAVFSSKRIQSGNLTDQDIKNAFLKYRPAQISLHRHKYSKELINWFDRNMSATLEYSMRIMRAPGKYRHYIDPALYLSPLETEAFSGKQGVKQLDEAVNGLLSNTFELAYLAQVSGYGGEYYHAYNHRYDGFAGDGPLQRSRIVTRPPQSAQQIGVCFLEAHHVLSRKQFLESAVDVGRALACSQSDSGGWNQVGTVTQSCDSRRQTEDVLPDELSVSIAASIIRFSLLLEEQLLLEEETIPKWLRKMIDSADAFVGQYSVQNGNMVHSQSENDLEEQVGGEKLLRNLKFDTRILRKENEHGYQTTQELVNRCLVAVEHVAGLAKAR